MKTILTIEIETNKMKPYINDGEDLSAEMEKEWHDQICKKIEDSIHDDDFEGSLMSDWIHEAEYLNPSAQEFSDLGELMIKITR